MTAETKLSLSFYDYFQRAAWLCKSVAMIYGVLSVAMRLTRYVSMIFWSLDITLNSFNVCICIGPPPTQFSVSIVTPAVNHPLTMSLHIGVEFPEELRVKSRAGGDIGSSCGVSGSDRSLLESIINHMLLLL